MKKIIEWIKRNYLLTGTLVVATFLRLYKLGSLPPGLHPDEAANGLDIISMIEKGKFAVVYGTNGPREALFFYLQAIFVYLGKITQWTFLNFTPLSLRIAPAILGIFTVLGIYLLGKELFNRNVGLFASIAMAVSSWHIQFSRNGFRAIMVPFALVFMFYFFIRAYRNQRLMDFVMTGAFLAIGFYTYLSFRLVPLILIALFIYIFVTDRKFITQNLRKIYFMTGAFLILMIPMFIHFVYVPADILGRASTSIFNSELNGGNPIKTLFSNILKTMMMFNFKGDANWRHNIAGLPMLDIFTGILFWIGLGLSFIRIRKIEYFLLIIWFGAMSIPEVLTAEGIPHALRMVGTMPVVFLWIGLGLAYIFEKFRLKYAATIGVMVIVVFSGSICYYRYFIQFPRSGDAGEAYAEDMVGIANDINKSPINRRNILIVGEYGTKTIDFITNSTGRKYERYEIRDVPSIKRDKGSYKIFIQKDWYQEIGPILPYLNINKPVKEVTSDIDGRIIYYEYEVIK